MIRVSCLMIADSRRDLESRLVLLNSSTLSSISNRCYVFGCFRIRLTGSELRGLLCRVISTSKDRSRLLSDSIYFKLILFLEGEYKMHLG